MKKLYSFQINDPNPMSISFSCVANSLEEAQEKTRIAGYKTFLLMETRELSGLETTSLARKEFSENPILGAEWRPLVEAFVDSFQHTKPGEFWTVNWMNDGLGPDEEDSLYLQALAESDGGLLLEIGPSRAVQDKIEGNAEMMNFLGWESPPGDHRLPNYLRWFDPGWNMWHVATTALQTLVLFMGVTASTKFTVGGYDSGAFDPNERLTRHKAEIDGIVYAVAYALPASDPGAKTQAKTSGREPSERRTLLNRLRASQISAEPAAKKATVASARNAKPVKYFNTRLVRNHESEYFDEFEDMPDWGDQYGWTWAAVNAFQSLADPSGTYDFPEPMTGEVEEAEERDGDARAYFSALLALTSFRLGWTKPSWGFARLRTRPNLHYDPTVMFIRQHFTPRARLALASFLEVSSPIGIDGQRIYEFDGLVPDEVRKYLNLFGDWTHNRFNRKVDDALWRRGGGYDPLHLSTHIGRWGRMGTHRLNMPLKETAPGLFQIALETGEGWYARLQNFAALMHSYDVSALTVDLSVEPIGFMGRYRYSNETGLWFACSEELHLLGNPV